jgi:hypothetical protein
MGGADDDPITAPATEHVLDGAEYLVLMREFAEQRSAYDEAVDPPLIAYSQLSSILISFNNDLLFSITHLHFR